MTISTFIKKSLLVSVSTLSAAGLLVIMPLAASAQMSPGNSQMSTEPNENEPGGTGIIRDDAAVESSQMEGDMMTPSTGTRSPASSVDGEVDREVGETDVPVNSSQTERDDAAAESSQIEEVESDSGMTPSTGTNNTSPTYSSPNNATPIYSSPTTNTPTYSAPTTTTPAASTNTSPRALW
ncbi:MAG: hypothetical protein WBA76_18820 [Phormidesmis sp.]